MMTRESPRPVEHRQQPISVEEAVRRIRILADLRERKKQGEPLNEKEERLLLALERNVNMWLDTRFAALALPPRDVLQHVAQWIYEIAKKNEEQKDYEESEWQWLQEEKKKQEGGRDPAYADRLSVYLMLMENAALARKWMVDQNTIKDDKDASPRKRIQARNALKAADRALKELKEHSASSVSSDVRRALAKMKKSEVYRDLFRRFQTLLLEPEVRVRAGYFIHGTMYPELKKVYNESVPKEVYNHLIAELEAKVRYAHTLAQIKVGLRERPRGKLGAA